MKQAKINCPHCAKPIIVREVLKKAQEEKILRAVDGAFDALEGATKRMHVRITNLRARITKGKKK